MPRAPARLGSQPQVRVTNMELFFDLVHVLAITRVGADPGADAPAAAAGDDD